MSVQRTFAVIERLAHQGPSTMRALARDLDFPLGSTHRLIAALADEGVVERTPHGEWQLSYKLVSIAGAQLARSGLTAAARPVLQDLAEVSGQTAFLATRSDRHVVYLDKVQSDAQVQLYVELGARRPLHCTGLGKAILAHLPPGELADVLDAPLAKVTQHTITDPDELRRLLDVVKSRGYATDNEEVVEGVSCVAAPLFDHTGSVVGAISIAGTDPRLRAADDELPDVVKNAAAVVSRQLGYAHHASQPTVPAVALP